MGQPKDWRGSLRDRLLSRLTVDTVTGCWNWTGAKAGGGYGLIDVGGRMQVTHRAAYELLVGPIPEGAQLDHLCRNRLCANPAHLEPVTSLENNRRSDCLSTINRAKSTCPAGHAYDYVDPSGRRRCRTCTNEQKRSGRLERGWH